MIDLENLPEPQPAEPRKHGRQLDSAPVAPDLARAVSEAIRLEYGPYSPKRYSASDAERDALAQTLAVHLLERPHWWQDRESGEPLSRQQRRGWLREALRHIARDDRGWLDSVADRDSFRERPRTRKIVIEASDVREQANAFREHESNRRGALLTSAETLASTYQRTDDPGDNRGDHLEIAAHHAREREAGELLPALAMAEHSRELTDRIASRVADALADLREPISLGGRERESLWIALAVASGERVASIAPTVKLSVPTVDRRAASGREILTIARGLGIDLVSIRRGCVADLRAVDRETVPDAWEPESIADVDAELIGASDARASVDRAWLSQERRCKLIAAGSESRPRVTPPNGWRLRATRQAAAIRRVHRSEHGSPRAVLAHIARIERLLARPAVSIDTTGARPLPAAVRGERVLARNGGPRLPQWAPRPGAEPGKPSGNHPGCRYWPDRTTAGQAGYGPHSAAVRLDNFRRAHPPTITRPGGEPEPAPVRVPVRPWIVLSPAMLAQAGKLSDERVRADALQLARRLWREHPGSGPRARALRVAALAKLALISADGRPGADG